jgi:hypothetical protein
VTTTCEEIPEKERSDPHRHPRPPPAFIFLAPGTEPHRPSGRTQCNAGRRSRQADTYLRPNKIPKPIPVTRRRGPPRHRARGAEGVAFASHRPRVRLRHQRSAAQRTPAAWRPGRVFFLKVPSPSRPPTLHARRCTCYFFFFCFFFSCRPAARLTGSHQLLCGTVTGNLRRATAVPIRPDVSPDQRCRSVPGSVLPTFLDF